VFFNSLELHGTARVNKRRKFHCACIIEQHCSATNVQDKDIHTQRDAWSGNTEIFRTRHSFPLPLTVLHRPPTSIYCTSDNPSLATVSCRQHPSSFTAAWSWARSQRPSWSDVQHRRQWQSMNNLCLRRALLVLLSHASPATSEPRRRNRRRGLALAVALDAERLQPAAACHVAPPRPLRGVLDSRHGTNC
jgi:hypothetical protein